MEKLLTWTGKEYEYQEKSGDWYWVFGIIAFSVIVASILLQSYVFALVVLAATFAFGVYAVRRAPEHTFSITNEGILIDEWLFRYESIISFSMVEYPDSDLPPMLTVYTRSIFSPRLAIPLSGVDPIEVYELIALELEEHDHEEPIVERILERFKF